MKYVGGSSWGLQALLVARTLGQFINWGADQINTSICAWEQPRAALVRGVVYLDGGDIYWQPGLASGKTGALIAPENYQGLILTYNLSIPFSADSNVTGILLQQELSKAPGGIGNVNGKSPNYYDGAMLANDDQFFLYGGAPYRNDEQYTLPDEGAYIEYQAFQYGPNKPAFQPGFHDLTLPRDVTRYIVYGAAANAPSENKAWYFSGLTSPSHGPIVQNGNASVTASNTSQTLISVDMSTQNFQKWSNKTLPDSVRGRANAELVWVPVGGQGLLVVIGGAAYPDWANPARISNNITGSQLLDAEFMSNIDVYDIENDKWYKQPAIVGGGSGSIPSARARGCAVVAPAPDFSSFNIFYYGGYNGLNPTEPFFDDVWVLSLPTFTWILINGGTTNHARSGHKCFSPYPDQMMVFGGKAPLGSKSNECLQNGPVLNFNLTSGMWMDSYDPTKFGDYGVHESITAVIGGNASGGATHTQPFRSEFSSGFADDALAAVFATPYDKSKLTKWWPYTPASALANPTGTTTTTPIPLKPSAGGGLPKWAPPVLGVVLAIIFITCAAVLFFLWRRRRSLKKADRSTVDSPRQSMISRIMESLYSPEKRHLSMASITSPIDQLPGEEQPPMTSHSSIISGRNAARHEMPDTPLVELDSTMARSELQDTGLTRIELDKKYALWYKGSQAGSPSPSEASFSPSAYTANNNPSIYKGFNGHGSPKMDSPPQGVLRSGSTTVMKHPPLPELDEGEVSSYLRRQTDTIPGIAELPHDAETVPGLAHDALSRDAVFVPEVPHDAQFMIARDFVSPLNAPEGEAATMPARRGHKLAKSSSQASRTSTATEDSRYPSSVRHIAFLMRDTDNVDLPTKREDGHGNGNGQN